MKYLVIYARQLCEDAGHFYVVQELTEEFCTRILTLAQVFQDVQAREPTLGQMIFEAHMPFYDEGVVMLPDPDAPGEEYECPLSESESGDEFLIVEETPDQLHDPDEPVQGGRLIIDDKDFYYEGFQENDADIETYAISLEQVRDWLENLRAGG